MQTKTKPPTNQTSKNTTETFSKNFPTRCAIPFWYDQTDTLCYFVGEVARSGFSKVYWFFIVYRNKRLKASIFVKLKYQYDTQTH